MSARAARAFVASMSAFLFTALLAAASSPRPTAIRWSAPAECPGERAFVAALTFRTDKVEVVPETATPTAWLEVDITRAAERYAGTLTVRAPSGATTRAVSGRRCETLVEALSLVAALLVDPEHARTQALPPEVLRPPPPPTEPEPVSPPPVPAPPAPTVDAPTPALLAGADVTSAPLADTPPPVQLELAAGLHGTTAISGNFDAGGHGTLSVRVRSFVARLTVGGGSGSTVEAAIGRAGYPFHLLSSLEAGWQFELGRFQAAVAVSASVVLFSVTALDAARPEVVWRWLLPLGPSVRAGWSFGALSVGALVQGGLNLRRDNYLVTPDGRVFTTPTFFIHPGLFVSYRL